MDVNRYKVSYSTSKQERDSNEQSELEISQIELDNTEKVKITPGSKKKETKIINLKSVDIILKIDELETKTTYPQDYEPTILENSHQDKAVQTDNIHQQDVCGKKNCISIRNYCFALFKFKKEEDFYKVT
jgi:hypothetical protein